MRPQGSEEQSKVLRAKKKHVMKDIEEWATQNLSVDLNQGNTRMSGKNDDTVTEIRMLRTKLIDLGVERYKFLNNYSHEKQKMMDLKKRKQQNLKSIRSYSTMSEPPRWRPCTSSSRPSTMDRKSDADTLVSRMYSSDQQCSEDSFKGSTYGRDERGPEYMATRPKTVQFTPSGMTKSDRDSKTVYSEPQSTSTHTGMLLRDNVSVVSFRPRSGFTDDDSRSWSSRRSKTSRYGGRVPSVTGDSRYALLEKALSSNYQKTAVVPVSDIVKKIGSLHVPPKNIKENKPKWELKIQAFKKEAGITW